MCFLKNRAKQQGHFSFPLVYFGWIRRWNKIMKFADKPQQASQDYHKCWLRQDLKPLQIKFSLRYDHLLAWTPERCIQASATCASKKGPYRPPHSWPLRFSRTELPRNIISLFLSVLFFFQECGPVCPEPRPRLVRRWAGEVKWPAARLWRPARGHTRTFPPENRWINKDVLFRTDGNHWCQRRFGKPDHFLFHFYLSWKEVS